MHFLSLCAILLLFIESFFLLFFCYIYITFLSAGVDMISVMFFTTCMDEKEKTNGIFKIWDPIRKFPVFVFFF